MEPVNRMRPQCLIAQRAAVSLVALLAAAACAQPTWSCSNGPPPPGRGAQGMAFDVRNHAIVMFGGSNNNDPPFSDTWLWNGTTWTQQSTNPPPARTNAGMAYDFATGNVLMFGGGHIGGVTLGDTWAWNGDSQVWNQQFPGVSPGLRGSPALVGDPDRGRIVMWGGADTGNGPIGCGTGDCRDTWEWDGTNWVRVAVIGPPPRRSHAMAFMGGGKVLLFGGLNDQTQPFGDTWEYDGYSNTWTQVFPPASPDARGGHVMMYESDTGRALLFGGDVGFGPSFNDTWEYRCRTWTQVAPLGAPAARSNFAGAYDTYRRRGVFFGGKLANGVYDTPETCEFTPLVKCGDPCYANCDGSTAIPLLTPNDFLCFLAAYGAGCS
jgi:hypothetical protein